MTVSNLKEDVQRPVKVIQTLHATKSANSSDDFGVGKHFQQLVASGATIPILTSSTIDMIPNNSLVRVRGMVQDMLNPEIFCNEYRGADGSWHTARFQDEIEEQVTSEAEVRYGDRRPYIIIPVPGESSWISDAAYKEAETSLAATGTNPAATTANAAAKRPREDVADDISMSMMVTDATIEADGEAIVDSAASQEAARACMVYLYSSDENIKLNDIVEVVGIVSRAPELAAAHLGAAAAFSEPGSLLDQEMLAAHPPTSQVPRIHAILANKEDPCNISTITTAATNTTAPEEEETVDMAAARARVLGFLSMVLGGDNLAAEYLLLQLVASVHHRSNDGAVGIFPLNITACPAVPEVNNTTTDTVKTGNTTTMSPLGEAITAALDSLVPRCLPLPLTLEKLNTASWVPRRGAEDSLMSSGALQIAAGTQLVVDETVLQSGQLNENGLRNLAALQGIMQQQKLAYDFQFFTMDQPTDAPVTVLSTARTMLKGVGEVVVPLQPTAPLAINGAAVTAAIAGGDVAPSRQFLAAVRAAVNKTGDFSIPEAVAAHVERDLAGAKQKDPSLTPESFHLWLNLARLLAVSHGEKELTPERWVQALDMEHRRQERIPKTASAAGAAAPTAATA
ncbi:hypothetical protein Ndes2437B_g07058 [Nannochloris sp. 'desiccata']